MTKQNDQEPVDVINDAPIILSGLYFDGRISLEGDPILVENESGPFTEFSPTNCDPQSQNTNCDLWSQSVDVTLQNKPD